MTFFWGREGGFKTQTDQSQTVFFLKKKICSVHEGGMRVCVAHVETLTDSDESTIVVS